jgi:hypothetical protein
VIVIAPDDGDISVQGSNKIVKTSQTTRSAITVDLSHWFEKNFSSPEHPQQDYG